MVWYEPRKTSKGKRYYVFWYENGKRHCTPAGSTTAQAITVRNNKERELLGGVPKQKTVGALYADFLSYIKSSQKQNTVEIIERSVAPFIEKHSVRLPSLITQEDVRDYKESLLRSYSKNGADIRFRTFRWFLAYGKRYFRDDLKEVAHIGSEKVARFLSKSEIKKLLAACQYNKELKRIVMVTLHTGLRRGEVLGLTGSQIHGHHLIVRQEKTDKDKAVPIQRTIEPLLRVRDGRVFPGWSADRLNRSFGRAVKRAKLGRVRFHDLRHTFASNWLKGGGDLASLSDVMGATLRVVKDTYAHFQPRHLKALADSIDFI